MDQQAKTASYENQKLTIQNTPENHLSKRSFFKKYKIIIFLTTGIVVILLLLIVVSNIYRNSRLEAFPDYPTLDFGMCVQRGGTVTKTDPRTCTIGKMTYFQQKKSSEYCSFENGCPTDKCNVATHCGSGGDGNGCTYGGSTCEYKDLNLKEEYTEVTRDQAKQCVQKFIASNQITFPTLKDLEINDKETGKESSVCFQSVDENKRNKQDDFCWFIDLKHKTIPDFPFAPQFYVGSQTCTVYWDIPDVFKEDIPTLMKTLYSPDQAITCAENYIKANKNKYLEYKNYTSGTLIVPEKNPGTTMAVKDYSKDINFYTVITRSNSDKIYLSVGAHSCKVYGVNEEYYTKL